LKLFEYEVKDIFAKYGIPVPKGVICETPDEVVSAFYNLKKNVVLKAQVLVGGRGKAGAIKFPKTSSEASDMAKSLFDMEIKGERVEKVYVEQTLSIEKEYYLGIITDTDTSSPLLIFASEGGMEIELLAKEKPEVIKKVVINPLLGLMSYNIRFILKESNLSSEYHQQIINIALNLYSIYWEMDGELIEINPLVLTKDGDLFAADAKLNIDNNALFRHPELPKREIKTVEDKAAKLGLSYVLLDGNIGIISNGAGLTMATMDHLNLAGGKPANFLDAGERILRDGVKDGMNIILENPNVDAILINIFAGGPRCDVIAEKIVQTIDEMEESKSLNVPVVVTLHGRYMEEGRKILSKCKSPHLYQELEIEDAVKKVIELGGKSK